jgi:hypothetical protein
MSFNAAPSGYFPGINTGAIIGGVTGVFIPYQDLENYNTSTTGDIRQLAYAFNEAIADTYLSLASIDRPSEMTVSRSQTFSTAAVIRKQYSNSFNLAYSGTLSMVFESGV